MIEFIIPVLNQHEETQKCVGASLDLASSPVKLTFIDNGSTQPLTTCEFYHQWKVEGFHDISVHRLEKNVGVYPTFDIGYKIAKSQFIGYLHNDVEFLEPHWDLKLKHLLERLYTDEYKPGVIGIFGARQLGTDDIYKKPYHLMQLQRWNTVANHYMKQHAQRVLEEDFEQVVTLDGFCLIINRDFVNSMGGRFHSEEYPPHHQYDNRICMQAHFLKFRNYVVNIGCIHYGGVTSCREDYAKAFGTSDLNIHREAHELFYKEFFGMLPVRV